MVRLPDELQKNPSLLSPKELRLLQKRNEAIIKNNKEIPLLKLLGGSYLEDATPLNVAHKTMPGRGKMNTQELSRKLYEGK